VPPDKLWPDVDDVQTDEILSGSRGSGRSARPRLCTTDTAVDAVLRSIRQFMHAASHLRPAARVTASSLVDPAVKMPVASLTHSRGCQAPLLGPGQEHAGVPPVAQVLALVIVDLLPMRLTNPKGVIH
jgi:hypothetical protein